MCGVARARYEIGVQLPSRLKATTLGDLLGALHRGRLSGTLELAEDGGRTHRIFLQSGLVTAVELDGESPALGEILRRDEAIDDDVLRRSVLRSLSSKRPLGEVLVADFCISPTIVGAALRRQITLRLQTLERLADARIFFRVVVRAPKTALTGEPLVADEFLKGRVRARDRRSSPPESGTFASAQRHRTFDRRAALAVLELPPDADAGAVKQAYRRLVRTYHPDLHPLASDIERDELRARFDEVMNAYRVLVA